MIEIMVTSLTRYCIVAILLLPTNVYSCDSRCNNVEEMTSNALDCTKYQIFYVVAIYNVLFGGLVPNLNDYLNIGKITLGVT